MFHLTRSQLLEDLHTAFQDAKRHKSKKVYVQKFEQHLEENLQELCDELWNKMYRPRPSSCFIITDPKKREVFAAAFRDRVVHHLYHNYTHELFERTFIQDAYSCITGRGTHYGIGRLQQHIRQESRNYSRVMSSKWIYAAILCISTASVYWRFVLLPCGKWLRAEC